MVVSSGGNLAPRQCSNFHETHGKEIQTVLQYLGLVDSGGLFQRLLCEKIRKEEINTKRF